MSILVRPDKNQMLLFTYLVASGYDRGRLDFKHPFMTSFKNYQKPSKAVVTRWPFLSKYVYNVLTLTEAPELEKQVFELDEVSARNVLQGEGIASRLRAFYVSSSFEENYHHFLGEYQRLCDEYQEIVSGAKIDVLLQSAWDLTNPPSMITIPMPLTNDEGFGIQLGESSYQVIGKPFDKSSLVTLLHEGAHPHARGVVASIPSSTAYLRAMGRLSVNEKYRSWKTFLEEHLVEAANLVKLYPALGVDIPRRINRLEEHFKLIYIKEAYQVVLQNKTLPLRDISLAILEKLSL